ncbi:glycerophosphodiester phosphodiesterase [Virgibacillus halophilus]|uniref:Glycerophosphodiester phosphodiesterase n=2 Tax=Tigheibacillus halophilus TaxID=361280 RepID=A0ABU5C3C7_9BACI|nr:glycerophosphodiester phosphodiesterase [Virgibacillus halophilus]
MELRMYLFAVICFVLLLMSGCGAEARMTTSACGSGAVATMAPNTLTGMTTDRKNFSAAKTGLLSPNRILNIAHRGASGYAPEHTLASYQKAKELDGDYLEIDLQMTKDCTLVAMHDEDVSRTTNSDGKVSDLSLDAIEALDAGTWFNDEYPYQAESAFSQLTVPTLEEVIDTFGSEVNYYIETKTPSEEPAMVDTLLRILQKHHLVGEDVPSGKVIIQSFSKNSLLEVHQKEPSIPLIQLIHFRKKAMLTDPEVDEIKSYAVGIGANYESLSKEFVGELRNDGLLIHPYTVNEPADMKRLIDWGVTGIFTNYPDRLHDVVDGMEGGG